MQFFLDTTETIPEGVGFPPYGACHLVWLGIFLLATYASCIRYRALDASQRRRWRRNAAVLLVLDEVFKIVMLLAGGNFMPKYLPFHLCSINIYFIALHAWKPNETLGNFLYLVCIPGALAALLFPSWTSLPLINFMHLHSFTIHILLALYPIVLTANGDVRPQTRFIPRSMLLLVLIAVPAIVLNAVFHTNFMFLREAETGNPLAFFEALWGNHLLGFPILIAAVLAVMYLPILILEKRQKKAHAE